MERHQTSLKIARTNITLCECSSKVVSYSITRVKFEDLDPSQEYWPSICRDKVGAFYGVYCKALAPAEDSLVTPYDLINEVFARTYHSIPARNRGNLGTAEQQLKIGKRIDTQILQDRLGFPHRFEWFKGESADERDKNKHVQRRWLWNRRIRRRLATGTGRRVGEKCNNDKD
ncbi:hypothetical protein EJ05DRAFT_275882 [Pseudovirgaria hyperparasitica]|uniref:Uncharacterized protein n=1 Tax=Pseudovirgaria hyperparasitica TaxID=470096 RepID=A0A6A6WBY9_9PEZI|nr:uncharacterized protein EJ05DRAFT_275882 [Pseudovirgaria hyperparasitica]KAF2760213.1 hypothetical protein EJ05DRAFT_275882 [Pseudovirgaria hyperparasitica]